MTLVTTETALAPGDVVENTDPFGRDRNRQGRVDRVTGPVGDQRVVIVLPGHVIISTYWPHRNWRLVDPTDHTAARISA
jgi:hypothetical protein